MSARGWRIARRTTLFVASLLAFVYLLGPPLWMIRSSFMLDSELRTLPPRLLPEHPTLGHFSAILQLGDEHGVLERNTSLKDFLKSARNSLIVATVTTILTTFLGAVFAYSISRFVGARQRKLILLGLLLLRMLPLIAVLIPIYLLMLLAGLLDTLHGLILVYTGLLLPFAIWILEGFFRQIPRELEEAASIDGATRFQTFIKIILPISWNGMFVAGAFVFVSTWSDFVVGLILTNSIRAYPISVVIASSMAPWNEPDWGVLNAAGLVTAIVPVLLAFALRGMVSGGRFAGATKG
ncbi:carbohydrate ABC transporter permease [Bosea sp. (in: a-proteobacteria)]|uniref:carbohydrate ABC transporter permease n=1 Tax=Bosea sp. (in: a-proteobacteria) TaxID=1871050 RepID=UPI00262309EF|nr:carbohydrate ABC transporter permease [Bosea sp. (in: a-proteobacteria)]MCO5089551.1 carbohydrate ABC transporter permease [Bosea sp. (in: a-proteobacteria)]